MGFLDKILGRKKATPAPDRTVVNHEEQATPGHGDAVVVDHEEEKKPADKDSTADRI